MVNSVLYSSKTDEWVTPRDLYDLLHQEFHFEMDPCSDDINSLCTNTFFRKEDNGLDKDWSESVFMNPPYSDVARWVKKAISEFWKGSLVVMLIPARTDTKYWSEIFENCSEIRFLKGRLRFSNSNNSAPFPSAVCILDPDRQGPIKVSQWDWKADL